MRGGNFHDNCENTMHRRVEKKKDVYNEKREDAERSTVNTRCLAAPCAERWMIARRW